MSRMMFAGSLAMIMALSLAPRALVCGSAQKHECSCCDMGDACTCCDIVPFYPEQAAASPEAVRVSAPEAWMATTGPDVLSDGGSAPVIFVVESAHGPPPFLKTTQLRI